MARKPYLYHYKGINIKIYPLVFSPKFTISTKVFIDFIETLSLKNKRVLELGAGNGLISFFCDKHGAKVTATDISDEAIKGLAKNKEALKSSITIVKSDLFEALGKNDFDYLFLNPPYYPNNPKNMEQKAWFCGEDFEFFTNFFTAYKNFKNQEECYMILSQDCAIDKIKQIAMECGFVLKEVFSKKKAGEKNYVYLISFSS